MDEAGRPRCRILHVVNHLHPAGVQRVACDLATNLDRSSFECGVVSLEHPPHGSLARILERADLVFWRLKPSRAGWLGAALQLRRIVRDWAPAIVHTHMASARAATALMILERDRPLLVTCQHDLIELPSLRGFRRWLDHVLLSRNDFCLAVSAIVAEQLVEVGLAPATRVGVYPNAVDLSRLRPPSQEQRRRTRAALGLTEDQLLVGAICILEKGRGVDQLMEAFSRLAVDAPDAVLLIGGDGPERAALEDLGRELGITDRLRMIGLQEDLRWVLHGLDVRAVPSSSEGGVLAAIEAMATGCPVVACGVGGLVELASTGAVYALPPDSPTALAEALGELARSQGQRAALSLAGLARVQEYSLDESLEEIEEFYFRMLGIDVHQSSELAQEVAA